MIPKILFILHLPPPIHGAAMMGKYIHDSDIINNQFDCSYLNLTAAKDLNDIGRFRVTKIVDFVKFLFAIRKKVVETKPSLVYVTPNTKGGGFYKDFVVVCLLKLLKCKIVVHFHNKGVVTRQDRFIDNIMYKHFFKGLKVILLAEALYQDICKYVDRRDVYVCPNGIPLNT